MPERVCGVDGTQKVTPGGAATGKTGCPALVNPQIRRRGSARSARDAPRVGPALLRGASSLGRPQPSSGHEEGPCDSPTSPAGATVSPSAVMTNDDRATFLDASEGWIRTRSGIERWHYSHVITCEMARVAAERRVLPRPQRGREGKKAQKNRRPEGRRFRFGGGRGGIRTHGLRFRRPALYPAELLARRRKRVVNHRAARIARTLARPRLRAIRTSGSRRFCGSSPVPPRCRWRRWAGSRRSLPPSSGPFRSRTSR